MCTYNPGVVGATSASSSSDPFSLTGVISVLCFSAAPLLPASAGAVANWPVVGGGVDKNSTSAEMYTCNDDMTTSA